MRKDFLFLAGLAVPGLAAASGYELPNMNPRDLGMVGSLVAAQDSAAAVYGNPAALARLDGLNLSAALGFVDFRSTWHAVPGTDYTGSTQSDSSIVVPPAVYASWSGRLERPDIGYGVGIGFTVAGGGNVFWPRDWQGRFDIVSVDRRIYGTYFMLAVEPLRWLRVGGGLIWYRGTEHLTQQIGFPGSELNAQVGTEGDAISFDLSAEIQPIQPLRIGFDYKHQGPLRLRGQAHFDNPPAELGAQLQDQGATHDLTFPNYLSVGVAYQLFPEILVTGQFTWYRFIVYDKDDFVGDRGFSLSVQRNYHNAHMFRVGAEYAPNPVPRLKVRAGLERDINPTPDEWMSPTIPDADIWAVAVGASYEILDGLAVHAAYFHAFYDEVTTNVGGADNVFPGRYNTRANLFSIGATWAVPRFWER
jgi:long-chain fatty acid transport protein